MELIWGCKRGRLRLELKAAVGLRNLRIWSQKTLRGALSHLQPRTNATYITQHIEQPNIRLWRPIDITSTPLNLLLPIYGVPQLLLTVSLAITTHCWNGNVIDKAQFFRFLVDVPAVCLSHFFYLVFTTLRSFFTASFWWGILLNKVIFVFLMTFRNIVLSNVQVVIIDAFLSNRAIVLVILVVLVGRAQETWGQVAGTREEPGMGLQGQLLLLIVVLVAWSGRHERIAVDVVKWCVITISVFWIGHLINNCKITSKIVYIR